MRGIHGPAKADEREPGQVPADDVRPRETVVILDFGAQYAQLIARRVREARVYSEILPCNTSMEAILALRPRGIILSGGPASVYAPGAPGCPDGVFQAGVPVLGICYGMQYMAHVLGGRVERAPKREYGQSTLEVVESGRLFRRVMQGVQPGSPATLPCWMSYGDRVLQPPPGFRVLARTENTPTAAMGNEEKGLYGVQFHPEVVHTPWGQALLEAFLFDICGCRGDWTMRSFVDESVEAIRRQVGDGKVICALSGGVDSAVAAALVHRAVGERLVCIFVDHGFMRKGEPEQVVKTFRDERGMNVVHVQAAERFIARIAGVADPEEKRKRIGREFIAVFEEEARRLGDVQYLVQGTVYPDVVESGSGQAAVIKSHHNVGGLPERMQLKLIEPLRQLFKDEVRQVGRELGLPEAIVGRQPFPGPGLAIRVIGRVDAQKLAIVREADAIVVEEIRRAGLYDQVWQSFAVLTDTRSVGVMGDERTYGYVVAVRAVTSVDGMTADWARLPAELLARIASRIMNEVEGVNRVVYDISSKPPATIEWE